MGDRWAYDVSTAQLQLDLPSQEMVAAVTRATTEDALMIIGQPFLAAPLATGDGRIDGASQGGTTLKLRGLAAGAVIPVSAMLSIIHAGTRYLHQVVSGATVGADGKASILVWPMLRFLTIDAEVVELVEPKIEGKLSGFAGGKRTRNRIDPISFTIAERA
ncbi:hypothetical protein KZ810_02725 [Sphingomonas sp. RHCKR47]|uniref:hypothetical protein n=1 Tax=Sphingomonas citricola TaxID=2862498 RepID=UPI001CA4E55A|nr:hypothetical protein [Sphingomonas citricola]MBW6522402.1 hypothetical protein [Sphingomonas citricola]